MVWTVEPCQYFQCGTSHHKAPCHATFLFTSSHHTVPHNTKLTTSHCQWFELRSRESTFSAARHTIPHLVMSPYITPRHATKHSNLLYSTTAHHPLARHVTHTTSCHTTPRHVTLRHDTSRYATVHYTCLKFFTESIFIVVLRYSLVCVCCHLSTACPSYLPPRWLAMYWLCSCSPYSAWWVNVLAL